MKLSNIFKSKKRIRNEMLLKEYEEGRILQVDNKVDNKEFFSKDTKKVITAEKTDEEKWIEGAINEGCNLTQIKKQLKSSNYPRKKIKKMIKYYHKLDKNDRLKSTETEDN